MDFLTVTFVFAAALAWGCHLVLNWSREYLHKKLVEFHRLDLIPALTRKGEFATGFSLNPLRRTAVFGSVSDDVFKSCLLLDKKPLMQLVWVTSEVSQYVVFVTLIAICVENI